MAKTNAVAQKPTYSPQQLQDFLNDIVLGKDVPLSYEEIFQLLETVDSGQMEELNSAYWTPKVNHTYNFIFEGMTEGIIKGKHLQQARLRNVDGETFIASQTVLVGTLKNVQVVPCFVRIIVGEKKEGKEGDYFDMKIKVLPGTRTAQLIDAANGAEHPFGS